MVKEAEAKCTQMLSEANVAAAENTKNADVLIAEENARVEEARQAAATKIESIEEQLRACLQTLEGIRTANRPAAAKAEVFDFDSEPDKEDAAAAVADEIASSLEALVGTTEDIAPKAEPKHPVSSTTKFGELKFGPNYNPTQK
jgi:uncharacterized protein (DUF1501 family)